MSELVARRLSDARVGKAFDPMYHETLRTEGSRTDRHRLMLFFAGDKEEAKAIVSRLIEEIGFESVDMGP